jgi:uncharacterized protein
MRNERPHDTWKNKWALVTGATSGIGAAIAEEFALCGAHLFLTGRRANRLQYFSRELSSRYGIQVHTLQADLTNPHAPDALFAFTQERGLEIAALVNNAGLGAHGEFHTGDLRTQLSMVQVHCNSVVHRVNQFDASEEIVHA